MLKQNFIFKMENFRRRRQYYIYWDQVYRQAILEHSVVFQDYCLIRIYYVKYDYIFLLHVYMHDIIPQRASERDFFLNILSTQSEILKI